MREEGLAQEAFDELQRFVSDFPRHAAGQNDLGCLADERGDLDLALACFRASLGIAPHALSARLNLIRVLCDMGRFPETTAHLQVLSNGGFKIRVNATETAVEIDLNGKPFYRGAAQKR